MEKIALFPGSFDPFTIGHFNIVLKGIKIFDRVVIGVGTNSSKVKYFPIEKMVVKIESAFINYPQVSVHLYPGLTADFAKSINAGFLIRGIRSNGDFEYERGIAEANRFLQSDLETIFLLADAEFSFLSSSIVRDIHRHGRDISKFLPFAL